MLLGCWPSPSARSQFVGVALVPCVKVRLELSQRRSYKRARLLIPDKLWRHFHAILKTSNLFALLQWTCFSRSSVAKSSWQVIFSLTVLVEAPSTCTTPSRLDSMLHCVDLVSDLHASYQVTKSKMEASTRKLGPSSRRLSKEPANLLSCALPSALFQNPSSRHAALLVCRTAMRQCAVGGCLLHLIYLI